MNRNSENEVTTLDDSAMAERVVRQSLRPAFQGAASAAMVNRTHRVVHERARKMQAQRSRIRSLSIPLAVSGVMLAFIVSAIWTILEQDELIPTGLPDANQQMLVLIMWCLPVTVLLLAVVLYRRTKEARDNGRAG